jgi:hypothetical protein
MNFHDVASSGGNKLTIFTDLEILVHHPPIGHDVMIPLHQLPCCFRWICSLLKHKKDEPQLMVTFAWVHVSIFWRSYHAGGQS